MASLRFPHDKPAETRPAQPVTGASATWLPQSLVATAILVGVLYFCLAVVAIFLSRRNGSMAMLWYANAAAVVVLQARAGRQWPMLLGAVAVGSLAAGQVFGDPVLLTLNCIPAHAVEIIIGALLLPATALPPNASAAQARYRRPCCWGVSCLRSSVRCSLPRCCRPKG